MATECSVAEIVLPSGALITRIPFKVAASILILSTPTPALAMTFKFVAALIIRSVTWV